MAAAGPALHHQEISQARLSVESRAATVFVHALRGRTSSTDVSVGRQYTGLAKWRQKRVADFVEDHLSEPIRLGDLARAAGLSRMHFAAQFRAATGVRPHEFVLRLRIERARDLLRDPTIPLAQVALLVGFQTQAHFTTVFRQRVQETPGRWRRAYGAR
jgi:AraC-like DNA-binding protein